MKERPIFMFHGMGVSCEQFNDISQAYPYVSCIESGSGADSFFGIDGQVNKACNIITGLLNTAFSKSQINIYSNGFYLFGHSQGGIIARGVFQFCPGITEFVKGIITYGTPNMGIDRLPQAISQYTGEEQFAEKAFKNLANGAASLVQSYNVDTFSMGPTEYLNKEIVDENNQIQHVKGFYIRKLEDDVTASQKYGNLDFMMNFQFLSDQMIHPIKSQTFDAYYSQTVGNTVGFETTPYYQQNQFSFKDLYDSGRMINCAVAGTHLNPDDNALVPNILFIVGLVDCLDYAEPNDKYEPNTFYKYCIAKKLQNTMFIPTYKCQSKPYKLPELAEPRVVYTATQTINQEKQEVLYSFSKMLSDTGAIPRKVLKI